MPPVRRDREMMVSSATDEGSGDRVTPGPLHSERAHIQSSRGERVGERASMLAIGGAGGVAAFQCARCFVSPPCVRPVRC